jgi:hypothetical protein
MTIGAGRFSLAPQPQPLPRLNPSMILSLPPLELEADGYVYRDFSWDVDFLGPRSLSLPDGSKIELVLSRLESTEESGS